MGTLLLCKFPLKTLVCLFILCAFYISNAVNRGDFQTQSSKLQNIEEVMAVKYITITHRIYEALKYQCLDF